MFSLEEFEYETKDMFNYLMNAKIDDLKMIYNEGQEHNKKFMPLVIGYRELMRNIGKNNLYKEFIADLVEVVEENKRDARNEGRNIKDVYDVLDYYSFIICEYIKVDNLEKLKRIKILNLELYMKIRLINIAYEYSAIKCQEYLLENLKDIINCTYSQNFKNYGKEEDFSIIYHLMIKQKSYLSVLNLYKKYNLCFDVINDFYKIGSINSEENNKIQLNRTFNIIGMIVYELLFHIKLFATKYIEDKVQDMEKIKIRELYELMNYFLVENKEQYNISSETVCEIRINKIKNIKEEKTIKELYELIKTEHSFNYLILDKNYMVYNLFTNMIELLNK